MELWKLPNGWSWTSLGELSDVVSKGTTPTTLGIPFESKGVPFLRAEDVKGGPVNASTVKYFINEETHTTTLQRSKLRPGDFLVTIAGSLGRVGYVPHNAPEMNCNQAVAFIRFRPKTVDLRFVSFACQYSSLLGSLLSVKKVGTIGNLNLQQIREYKIPLPPLPEQKRIAGILEKADRLRRLRRYARKLSNTFLPSVFLEMFGDPVANSRNWPVIRLGNHAMKISSGLTPRGGESVYSSSGIRFIRSQNVRMKKFDFSNVVYISDSINAEMENTQVLEDDVLLNITGASIGRVACYQDDAPANVNQHVCIIRVDKTKIKPRFLSNLISSASFQVSILSSEAGATRQALNYSQIREFQIILPPVRMQEEFIVVVDKYYKIRKRYDESARQSDQLFLSLLHRGFRAEI